MITSRDRAPFVESASERELTQGPLRRSRRIQPVARCLRQAVIVKGLSMSLQ